MGALFDNAEPDVSTDEEVEILDIFSNCKVMGRFAVYGTESFFNQMAVDTSAIPNCDNRAEHPKGLQRGAPVRPPRGRKGPKHAIRLNEPQLAAFHQMVENMTQPPDLDIFKLVRHYSIDTDASDRQIGVSLYQTDEEGRVGSSRRSATIRPPKRDASYARRQRLQF